MSPKELNYKSEWPQAERTLRKQMLTTTSTGYYFYNSFTMEFHWKAQTRNLTAPYNLRVRNSDHLLRSWKSWDPVATNLLRPLLLLGQSYNELEKLSLSICKTLPSLYLLRDLGDMSVTTSSKHLQGITKHKPDQTLLIFSKTTQQIAIFKRRTSTQGSGDKVGIC